MTLLQYIFNCIKLLWVVSSHRSWDSCPGWVSAQEIKPTCVFAMPIMNCWRAHVVCTLLLLSLIHGLALLFYLMDISTYPLCSKRRFESNTSERYYSHWVGAADKIKWVCKRSPELWKVIDRISYYFLQLTLYGLLIFLKLHVHPIMLQDSWFCMRHLWVAKWVSKRSLELLSDIDRI